LLEYAYVDSLLGTCWSYKGNALAWKTPTRAWVFEQLLGLPLP
jgi:hypothetical protein